MIQLVPQLKVLLACEPVDFRKGLDSLAALCKTQLGADPFSGALFIFRNRRGTALKLLVFDGTGYWFVLRRFSQGHVRCGRRQTPHLRFTHCSLTNSRSCFTMATPTGLTSNSPGAGSPDSTPLLQAAAALGPRALSAHRHGVHCAGERSTARWLCMTASRYSQALARFNRHDSMTESRMSEIAAPCSVL